MAKPRPTMAKRVPFNKVNSFLFMATKSKAFKVKAGNTVLTVAPHAKGWRFGYETPEGWRYITRRKRADIVDEGERVLEEKGTGFLWSALPKRRRELLEKVH